MPSVDSLVIGANGLIGRRLLRLLKRRGISSTGTYNKRPEAGLIPLDITDTASLAQIIKGLAPKHIYLCANLAGGVNYCEKNNAQARKFYYDATVNIGQECARTGSSLIFVSTDYVFDGTKGPYREDDGVNPLNIYGRLKLDAEEWIRKNLENHIIARTTNVFGWDPDTATPNYVMNLYRTVKQGVVFNAPSYLWGNPTYAEDLAAALAEMSGSGAAGTFHVVGSSFTDRYDWALKACDILGLDRGLVKDAAEPPVGMVPRPLKPRMDTSKFTGKYKTVLHSVTEGLELMKDDIDERKPAEK